MRVNRKRVRRLTRLTGIVPLRPKPRTSKPGGGQKSFPYPFRGLVIDRPNQVWNALAYLPKGQQSMVAAALRQAFLQPDRAAASQTLRHVADQLRGQWPKLGDFIDDSEVDVLTFLDFPAQHRTRIHSTNSLERLNKEVKRRADVVGIFPNERAIIRLIGAVLLDANDEWQIRNRYMQTEPMAELLAPIIDAETTRISTATA